MSLSMGSGAGKHITNQSSHVAAPHVIQGHITDGAHVSPSNYDMLYMTFDTR